RDRILIDAAAGEDGHVAEPALVEDASYLLGQRDQVAAVETHTAHRDARGFESRRERDNLTRRRLGIVGVDEQGQILWPRTGEILECLGLIVVHLDVRI